MFLYNCALGALAGLGAIFAGPWVLRSGWHWAAKLIVFGMLGVMLYQSWALIMGGPGSDLRIVTELLASYGGITAASRIVQRPGNPWVQYGIPALLVIFLTVTWWEQIERFQDGGARAFVGDQVTPDQAQPASQPQEATPRKNFCDENISVYQREQLGCPPK